MGRTRASARQANDLLTINGFFGGLGERCQAVIEAGWNWGVMYDCLDTIENVAGVFLRRTHLPRRADGAEQQVAALGAGGSGLGRGPA
jgi:hypothetical protein